MATSGKRLTESEQKAIRRAVEASSIREAARNLRVSRRTVQKVVRQKQP